MSNPNPTTNYADGYADALRHVEQGIRERLEYWRNVAHPFNLVSHREAAAEEAEIYLSVVRSLGESA